MVCFGFGARFCTLKRSNLHKLIISRPGVIDGSGNRLFLFSPVACRVRLIADSVRQISM